MCKVVRALLARDDPSPELLAYKTGRVWRNMKSGDANDYLRAATGSDVTAKDFHTWHATVLMAVGLAVSADAAATPTARKRAVARAVGEVAYYLGNTPAVCRSANSDHP